MLWTRSLLPLLQDGVAPNVLKKWEMDEGLPRQAPEPRCTPTTLIHTSETELRESETCCERSSLCPKQYRSFRVECLSAIACVSAVAPIVLPSTCLGQNMSVSMRLKKGHTHMPVTILSYDKNAEARILNPVNWAMTSAGLILFKKSCSCIAVVDAHLGNIIPQRIG